MEDTFILGGGPSGLFCAAELARHGIRARVVDRTPVPHHTARATAIQPATLEILARAGIVNDFLRVGVHLRRAGVYGPGLVPLVRSDTADLDCAYPFECSLPQWRTEEILEAHLKRLGGSLQRGIAVTSIEPGDDHVRLTLEGADGSQEVVQTRYLIGAGGAHSITRSSMHERLEGETYAGTYIVADGRLANPVAAGEGAIAVGSKGFVLFGPLPEQRWIIFVEVGGEDAAMAEPPDSNRVSALINERMGIDAGLHDVCWTSLFRMHHRQAPVLADGRRFLIGDAGHLSSPVAGEGLNAGLWDAADLAWKLALVLRGRGRPLLLKSYAIERGMADRHAVAVSDRVHNFVAELVKTCACGGVPTPAPPDPPRDRAFQCSRAMLDISYAGSPLIGEHLGAGVQRPDGPAPGERYPDRIALAGVSHHLLLFGDPPANGDRFRHRWTGLVDIIDAGASGLDAARAGVPDGGAVLIRPDGVIGFRAVPADDAGLGAVDDHLVTYLIADTKSRSRSPASE